MARARTSAPGVGTHDDSERTWPDEPAATLSLNAEHSTYEAAEVPDEYPTPGGGSVQTLGLPGGETKPAAASAPKEG